MDPQNSSPVQGQNGGSGFLIATIILVLVIIVGAIYFWRERSMRDDALESGAPGSTLEIEANLNATSTEQQDYNLDEGNFNAS